MHSTVQAGSLHEPTREPVFPCYPTRGGWLHGNAQVARGRNKLSLCTLHIPQDIIVSVDLSFFTHLTVIALPGWCHTSPHLVFQRGTQTARAPTSGPGSKCQHQVRISSQKGSIGFTTRCRNFACFSVFDQRSPADILQLGHRLDDPFSSAL